MSVMQINIETFESLKEKFISYCFNKQCDINYCSVIHNLTEKQIEDLLKNWCDLNEMSYNSRYKQEPDKLKTSEFINFKRPRPIPNTYQALKWLECIEYNIEVECETDEQKESIVILHKAIEQIKSAIIGEITEYKNSNWN